MKFYEGKELYIFDNAALDIANKCTKVIKNHLLETKTKCKDISKLHDYISISEINNFRLNCFRKINNQLNWKSLIRNSLSKYYRPLIGKDVLIQTKLNLSIQMPNDQNSILSLHSDCNSGDSPFQFNIWIPLTDSWGTNSMFILDKETSMNYLPSLFCHEGINANKKEPIPHEKDFLKTKKGDLIIFNPLLLHGNVRNNTDHTRFSLNVRLKSIFTPDGDSPDRKVGTYYEILETSIHTDTALDYINLLKDKS